MNKFPVNRKVRKTYVIINIGDRFLIVEGKSDVTTNGSQLSLFV